MSALFWTCAALIVVAQVMILRSTRRAFRGGAVPVADVQAGTAGAGAGTAGAPAAPGAPRSQSPVLEWFFAVGPAVALAFLLYFTWRAASAPPVMDVRFGGPTASAIAP